MDLTRIPRVARESLNNLIDRDAAATTPYIDELPPIPHGVKDAYAWRLLNGHINAAPTKPVRLETRGPEALEVLWRDGP